MKDNIKIAVITAFSIGLTLYIGRLFKIDSPFYASVAAAVVSQSSYKEVFKLGIKRVYGTILGALAGLVFYWFIPHNFIYYSIGIFMIVFICSVFIDIPSNMACIVFLAISTNLKGSPPGSYAIYRVIDTCLGIFIALMVSYIFKYLENKMKNFTKEQLI